MRKTLLTLFSGLVAATMASAQCTPDPAYANAEFGLWPDSLEFITDNAAYGGEAYEAVIDIKTLKDTTVPDVPTLGSLDAVFDAFRIASVSGQPAGFEYAEAGPTFDMTNGWENEYGVAGDPSTITTVQGCLAITADAASVSAAAPATGYTDYPLLVEVDARIAQTSPNLDLIGLVPNGTWLTQLAQIAPDFGISAIPVTEYVLRVHASVGINSPQIGLYNLTSYPEPVDEIATIQFNNTGNSKTLTFNVYSLLGEMIHSEVISARQGDNRFNYDASALVPGMYVYTLGTDTHVTTKKMTVR